MYFSYKLQKICTTPPGLRIIPLPPLLFTMTLLHLNIYIYFFRYMCIGQKDKGNLSESNGIPQK